MRKGLKKYKKLAYKKRKTIYSLFVRHSDIIEIAKICKAKPEVIFAHLRFLRRAVRYLNWYRQNKSA